MTYNKLAAAKANIMCGPDCAGKRFLLELERRKAEAERAEQPPEATGNPMVDRLQQEARRNVGPTAFDPETDPELSMDPADDDERWEAG